MKDAVLIVFGLITVFALLSWASAPPSVAAERAARVKTEQRVEALSTEVAYARSLLPTPERRCSVFPYC
jgi:hypothetical protein